MTKDEENLDLLGIFHYVFAGLTALFSCVGLLHLGLGLAMIRGAFGGRNAPPPGFGFIFLVMGALFVLFGWALAVAIFIAGKELRRRKSRTYCLVIGWLECMITPFGTVLGVFTIVELMKDSVKALFAPLTLDVVEL